VILSASPGDLLGTDYFAGLVNFSATPAPFTLTTDHLVATPTPTPTPTATPTPTDTPTPTATPSPTPTPTADRFDLNHDGTVDAADLVLLFNDMDAGNMEADFNHDGKLDADDCLMFSEHWGQAASTK